MIEFTEEERGRIRGIAADLDERAPFSRYQSEADGFREDAAFLRELANRSAGDAEGLREHLNATFNRWADKRYADSVTVVGNCEKSNLRAAGAAFRNAADYVFDSALADRPAGDAEGLRRHVTAIAECYESLQEPPPGADAAEYAATSMARCITNELRAALADSTTPTEGE